MKTFGINQKKEIEISQGTLLCSTPVNTLGGFQKSIVLITRYNAFGTIGIVLNAPLDSFLELGDLMNNQNEIPLNYGGPDDNLLSFIISIPSMPDGLRPAPYWSRNRKDLMLLMKLINAEEVLINAYKGSMQWSPGELEQEIRNGQWWATDEYSTDQLFENKSDIYKNIARQVSGNFAPLIDADIPIFYN